MDNQRIDLTKAMVLSENTKPTIISLSGKAQHGKSSVCEIIQRLSNKRCLQVNYADYLKYIAKQYYGWDGKKDDDGRTLLQQLGTEKVRSKYPSFWVDTVIRLINAIGEDYDLMLISDARFPDEVQRWKEEGYDIKTIHVDRLGYDNGLSEEQKNHKSETALDGFKFDYYLSATNLEELEKEVKEKLLFIER